MGPEVVIFNEKQLDDSVTSGIKQNFSSKYYWRTVLTLVTLYE